MMRVLLTQIQTDIKRHGFSPVSVEYFEILWAVTTGDPMTDAQILARVQALAADSGWVVELDAPANRFIFRAKPKADSPKTPQPENTGG
jgi:hypothetical protein